jgi:hypothetical protein
VNRTRLLALRIYVGRIFQTVPMSHLHYLPLAPRFFAILVGFFFIVLILRSVRYAYESLGVSSNTAIFLLPATLIVALSAAAYRNDCREGQMAKQIA